MFLVDMQTQINPRIVSRCIIALTWISGSYLYNHMVNDSKALDLIFGALSDPTRRGILAQLSTGEMNVSTLAKPYDMSQPAISKHLRVLENAGLIERSRRGREHFVRANAKSAERAAQWIAHYNRFWRQHFDEVDVYLQQNAKEWTK